MQFLSITAVLLNLVLIQDVAAVNAVKAAIPNPMCQYRPDNCVANDYYLPKCSLYVQKQGPATSQGRAEIKPIRGRSILYTEGFGIYMILARSGYFITDLHWEVQPVNIRIFYRLKKNNVSPSFLVQRKDKSQAT
ncbi:hypothetical protein BLS_008998, partial [Venturia inaequalis]